MISKEKIVALMDSYNRSIANLEWHIINNGKMISEEEKATIKQRITDFKNFNWELERLMN